MQIKVPSLQMNLSTRMYMPKSNRRDRSITYASAINEATRQLMAQDDSVFVLGIGVDDPRGIYGTTSNLSSEFGQDRVVNMPLAEDYINEPEKFSGKTIDQIIRFAGNGKLLDGNETTSEFRDFLRVIEVDLIKEYNKKEIA